MATEAQRQRNIIDSGFLDNVGAARTTPLQLNNVEQIFVKWMGLLVEALQRNLHAVNGGREINAGGNLSESIRFEYRVSGRDYIGEVYMADYADYVDKGVQGIGPNSRNTTSPYKFKTAFPSKDMQNALILWVRQKHVLSDATAPRGLMGRNTRGYLRNKVRRNTLAIALGISIKRHGTRATNFKQISVDEIMDGMKRELAAAMAKDIRININTDLLR
ncbi:hypothetical protein [Chitinophaga sp. HK235]|uniref:hypothetical protein n=1 Tax=Chitinophaga sp. HK235 TaxID=2952571 RepID=UPI001BA494A5|nr:hypothetical protein [Chitinophaga sp. HK235]